MAARSWFQSPRSNAFRRAVELRVLPSTAPPNALASRFRPATSRWPGRVLLRKEEEGAAEVPEGEGRVDVEGAVETWTAGGLPGDGGNNIAPPPLPLPLPVLAAPSFPDASANLTGLWSLSPPLLPVRLERMLVFDENGFRWNERLGRRMWVCGEREGEGEGRSESILLARAVAAGPVHWCSSQL